MVQKRFTVDGLKIIIYNIIIKNIKLLLTIKTIEKEYCKK